MTDDRLAHLHDVGRLLWPAPLEVSVGSAERGRTHREYLLLPNARRPRLLVPAGRRRAAAGAVRRYGVGRGWSARVAATGLAAGLATGLAPLVARDRVRVSRPGGAADDGASIETHLAEVLGREVLVSMYLGAPRANRKPVLQVLDRDGRTVAFVKVGVDDLTAQLVRDETAALTALNAADLRHSRVPAVLHSGWWNGLELLVQAPLPVDSRRGRPRWDRVVAAQAEVAAIGGTAPEALAATPYWSDLSARVARLPETAAAETLTGLMERIAQSLGDVPLPLGAWHGDWTPWNTAQTPRELLVWDWERFAPAVPVGYDALHWTLQTDLVNRLADPGESVTRTLATAAPLLETFGSSPEQSRATGVGYLTELAVRYLTDRQAEAGARLGDVGAWLLPGIDAALAGG